MYLIEDKSWLPTKSRPGLDSRMPLHGACKVYLNLGIRTCGGGATGVRYSSEFTKTTIINVLDYTNS